MIASVTGRVAALGRESAVVEVGGVGLLLVAAPPTLARLRVGQEARLATSLVVREDSLTLHGFADDDERATFELLQTASGVGPRLALAVLTTLRPAEVRAALRAEDLTSLCRVSGVGRKGAQRMVLELKDRVGALEPVDGMPPPLPGRDPAEVDPWRGQLHAALTSLGYSGGEADRTVEALAAEVDGVAGSAADLPSLLRAALRRLGAPGGGGVS